MNSGKAGCLKGQLHKVVKFGANPDAIAIEPHELLGCSSSRHWSNTIFNGGYSFNAVSNGVYTLTPSQPGNVFMPGSGSPRAILRPKKRSFQPLVRT